MQYFFALAYLFNKANNMVFLRTPNPNAKPCKPLDESVTVCYSLCYLCPHKTHFATQKPRLRASPQADLSLATKCISLSTLHALTTWQALTPAVVSKWSLSLYFSNHCNSTPNSPLTMPLIISTHAIQIYIPAGCNALASLLHFLFSRYNIWYNLQWKR